MDKQKSVQELDEVVVRFSGDSGDGMQLTGTLFADASALFGNDVSTFPDYPSEIRAPQGTIGGVSGFQVHFGNRKVNTPGDFCDVLIAMNPAALKANAKWVKRGGMIIVDADQFNEKGTSVPATKLSMQYRVKPAGLQGDFAPITNLTKESLKDSGLDNKSIIRSKNMFALGMVYYIFDRPLNFMRNSLKRNFQKSPK